MTTLAVILLLAAFQEPQPQPQPQETKPVPKGSVEIVTTGCVTGKSFAAMGPREDGVRKGPDVRGRTFRLNGPKDVMKDVKRNDGHLVEVVGLVRSMDLAEPMGARIGGTRVTLGSPNRSAPSGSAMTNSAANNTVIMDISSLRPLADSCRVAGH
jgi:hypothetical protein